MAVDELRRRHWRMIGRTAAAAALIIGGALMLPRLAGLAPDIFVLRFPLPYLVATILPAIVIVVAYFGLAARQSRLDRQFGLTNEF